MRKQPFEKESPTQRRFAFIVYRAAVINLLLLLAAAFMVWLALKFAGLAH